MPLQAAGRPQSQDREWPTPATLSHPFVDEGRKGRARLELGHTLRGRIPRRLLAVRAIAPTRREVAVCRAARDGEGVARRALYSPNRREEVFSETHMWPVAAYAIGPGLSPGPVNDEPTRSFSWANKILL
jgi:hypothetical protein